ncbi:MAG: HepT-like ribonuclease domain-containing protein [Gammaproteobacteria bacterium]
MQGAYELCIDIAKHLIKTKQLGLPQDSKDSFSLLQRAGLIDEAMMVTLQWCWIAYLVANARR